MTQFSLWGVFSGSGVQDMSSMFTKHNIEGMLYAHLLECC